MEMNELTPEKSICLISEIINQSRKDFKIKAEVPFLLWGAIVIVVSAVIWILVNKTGDYRWNFLWFAIPVVAYPLNALVLRNNEPKAKYFLNELIGLTWIMFGIISCILSLVRFFVTFDVVSLILVLLGFTTIVNGLIIKHYYISACGIIVAISGPVLCALSINPCLMMIFGSFFALLFPGIILKWSK